MIDDPWPHELAYNPFAHLPVTNFSRRFYAISRDWEYLGTAIVEAVRNNSDPMRIAAPMIDPPRVHFGGDLVSHFCRLTGNLRSLAHEYGEGINFESCRRADVAVQKLVLTRDPGDYIEAVSLLEDAAAACQRVRTGLFSDPSPKPHEEGHPPRKGEATLSPESRALAAALELKKAGQPVSVNAACKRAGVCRKNLNRKSPNTIHAIEQMAIPDRPTRRGFRDARTGRIEAEDLDK